MSPLLSKNLNNLHDFWSATSSEKRGDEIYVHLQWPHKIWCNNFARLESELWQKSIHVTVEKPSPDNAITIKTSLMAMHLFLDNVVGKEHKSMIVVNSHEALSQWCHACGLAFGYQIPIQSLIPLLNDDNATLLAFQENGEMVGTAILYQSGENMGIHQVGVLPNFQGRGLGKALMLDLVERTKSKGCSTMTLQASNAGTPIYLKMGFTPLTELYHLENKISRLTTNR